MKSNITQAFFWKTGKKMEINSTVTGISEGSLRHRKIRKAEIHYYGAYQRRCEMGI